jgi:phage terminase small subunit
MIPVSILKNAKHEAFCQLIAVEKLPPAQAYENAGYSPQGAYASASRLLKNAEIDARIDEIKASIALKVDYAVGVSKSWVILSLKEVVDRCMQSIQVLDHEGNPTGEYQFQHSGANKALELIGKELGMFSDRVKLSGADGGDLLIKAVIDWSGKRE